MNTTFLHLQYKTKSIAKTKILNSHISKCRPWLINKFKKQINKQKKKNIFRNRQSDKTVQLKINMCIIKYCVGLLLWLFVFSLLKKGIVKPAPLYLFDAYTYTANCYYIILILKMIYTRMCVFPPYKQNIKIVKKKKKGKLSLETDKQQ